MYNHKYVSIKQIADKIKRGKLYQDIPFESIIDYTIEAMRLIMSENFFITKPARLKVESHKTQLPCDFEIMIQATKYDCTKKVLVPMRYGSDNFHSIYHIDRSPDTSCLLAEYTYTINNNIIHTNFEEGELLLAYKAIPSDKEGLPMIPDNVNVKLAVEYYIKSRYLEDLGSDEPSIERRRQADDQQYCWYVGKAQAASTNMTMDEMESFANSMSQLFIDTNQFKYRLEGLGMQEYRTLN